MKRRMAPGLLALFALSGCAAGSSMSISQAPLSFVVDQDGGYEVGARNDGTSQALAENGTFESGIPGYTAVGGNALLPVTAALTSNTAVDAAAANVVLGVTSGPAGADAGASITAGADNALATQVAVRPAGDATVVASVSPNGASVGAALQSPGTSVATQLALSPSAVTVNRTLTTAGPLLGAPTTVQALTTSTPAGASNALLAAAAAQIGKHCTLPGCK